MSLRAAARAGAADVGMWRHDPSALPELRLGAFDEAPPVQLAFRRALLSLRVPPGLVARLAPAPVVEALAYWRGVRKALGDRDAWRRLTQGTTILMYHAFAADGEAPSRFVLPRRKFERQMRWLGRRRPVLALDELLAYRRSNLLPPAGAVVVTIDDGYDDVRTLAHPVLRRHRIPATLFVVTGRMGNGNLWNDDGPLAGRPIVSWADASGLHHEGLALGAHTRTHPVLPELPPAGQDDEIAGSYSDLEEALGEPVETFAYPYGKWNEETADSARRAGFAVALSVRAGRNCAATAPYALRRTEVEGTDSFLRFLLGVRFGDTHILGRIRARLRRP
jgi:peptidoglycan/xylan/chitin deacetylase (PgdA/CDA1 family)